MAGQVVNFADLVKAAGDAGYQLFPKGWYDLIVDSAEGGTTGNDKPCVKMQFRITSGPYASSTTKLRDTESITADSPGALGFFFSRMEAMGLPRSWFEQLPPMESSQLMSYVAQALVGRPFRGYVDDERVYNGRRQNDVTEFQPPGGGPSALPQTQFGTPVAGPAPMAPTAVTPQPGSPGGLQQFAPPAPQTPGPIAAMPQQFAERGQALGQAAQQMLSQQPPVPQFQQPPAPQFQQPVGEVPAPPAPQQPQAPAAALTPPPSPFTQPASPFPMPPQAPQAAPPPPPAAQPPPLPFQQQQPAQAAPQVLPPNGQPEQQQQQQQLPPPPPPAGQMPF